MPDSIRRRFRPHSLPHVNGGLAHTCTVAALPLVNVVAANSFIYPIDPTMVFVGLAALVAAVFIADQLLSLLGWDGGGRSAWLSIVLLVSAFYKLLPGIVDLGPRPYGGHWQAALVYVTSALAVATLATRPWRHQRRRHLHLVLATVAAVMLGSNLGAILQAGVMRGTEPAVARAVAPGTSGAVATAERDVYFVILDGFARADVVRDRFGVDMSTFVTMLEDAGFYVPSNSRSNYSQTFLAVSSMLNMNYLDELVHMVGEQSRDRRPLKFLIEHNALMAQASRAGMTVVAIGSDYTATDAFPDVDLCICGYRDPHELHFAALGLTPIGDLALDAWQSAARRRKALHSLDAIERQVARPGRKLVFAHILLPHPPFVFDADGGARTPGPGAPYVGGEWLPRSVRDRPSFRDEYARGYAAQVTFLTRRIEQLVHTLTGGAGPEPAIVLLGDHGSALTLDDTDISRTDLRERMSIFSAYRLPGYDGPALYSKISPVNGTRAVARFLGLRLPFLEEKSSFSTYNRPFALTRVSVP